MICKILNQSILLEHLANNFSINAINLTLYLNTIGIVAEENFLYPNDLVNYLALERDTNHTYVAIIKYNRTQLQ